MTNTQKTPTIEQMLAITALAAAADNEPVELGEDTWEMLEALVRARGCGTPASQS